MAGWHGCTLRHRRCGHRAAARSRDPVGPDGHQATFGLWLTPLARGRGVGTRALRAVADWTFATTAAFRLDAYIMVGNDASMRMTERAGFQREGVARAWDLHHDGVPVDCVVYSRLRTDD